VAVFPVIVVMMIVIMRMVVVAVIVVIVTCVIMMLRIVVMVIGVMRVSVTVFGVLVGLIGLWRLGGIEARVFNDFALDAVATAAPSRVSMTRTAPVVGAILVFFLGLAMGALIGLDQRLAIGDRNLIIVRMDFAEGQKAMAVAAIFDEGGLQ
jgi:hypothetical protein